MTPYTKHTTKQAFKSALMINPQADIKNRQNKILPVRVPWARARASALPMQFNYLANCTCTLFSVRADVDDLNISLPPKINLIMITVQCRPSNYGRLLIIEHFGHFNDLKQRWKVKRVSQTSHAWVKASFILVGIRTK